MRLFRFERRWLLTVARAILPSGATPRLPDGAARYPLSRFLDDLLASAPPSFVVGLRFVLWLVVLTPILTIRRPRTFFGLGARARVDHLHALRGSRIYLLREAPVLLKTAICLGFCGLPELHRGIGYGPTDTEPPEWAGGPS